MRTLDGQTVRTESREVPVRVVTTNMYHDCQRKRLARGIAGYYTKFNVYMTVSNNAEIELITEQCCVSVSLKDLCASLYNQALRYTKPKRKATK